MDQNKEGEGNSNMQKIFGASRKRNIFKALSKNKSTSWIDKFYHTWKSQDIYGKKVEFTYKGHKRFKTLLGATFTFIQRVIITIFIVYQLYMLYSRKHPITHSKPMILDYDQMVEFNLRDKGFDLGFKLEGDNLELMDMTYGEIIAEQQINYKNSSTLFLNELDDKYSTSKNHQLTINKCDNKNFNQISSNDFSRYDISSYYCINSDQSFILEGDVRSQVYQNIQVSIKLCQNSTNFTFCKSKEQILEFFQGKKLNYIFTNTNFDFTSYGAELQYYIDDQHEIFIEMDRNQVDELRVKQAFSQQWDNVFTFWDYSYLFFFQLDGIFNKNYPSSIVLDQNNVAAISIHLERKSIKYVRLVENVFDVLESIGGFKESIHSIILIMIIFFQERLFKGSFIKQLYQEKVHTQQKKQYNTQQSMNASSALSMKTKPNSIYQLKKAFQEKLAHMNKQEIGKRKCSDMNVLESIITRDHLHDNMITRIIDEILLRKSFQYGYRMIIDYLFKLICCKSVKRLKTDGGLKQLFKYLKGNERLEQELDIVNLLKSIRQMKSLIEFLLPLRRRILLKFSKKNLIQTSSSSSDSDYYQNDIINHLNGKNQFKKLSAIAKIKRILLHYKNNIMDDNDKVLIKGIFIKRAKDFHDDILSSPMMSIAKIK
ncbi:UNKNOWN [Stylonychia lemnae]|uniref:Transmembrane protein n=1 Tax=Stylonychia lemnae TaxID=5949 RepID=A0A078B3G7_STYLE|nr:UNKNOWN [Stylonychia lemnae]|eukprot:CDW88989.1 UNKNOWN [Stylonychia lemnae]